MSLVGAVVAGLAATLQPGGVPAGGIAAVYPHPQPVPYGGPWPAIFLRQTHGEDRWFGALSRQLNGVLMVTYVAALPNAAHTMATIEEQLRNDYDAIVAAIMADRTLGGSVAGVTGPIVYETPEENDIAQVGDALVVTMLVHVPYLGHRRNVPAQHG